MKQLVCLLLIAILFTSCFKGDGKLSGNAFWKFNNYVGNKPDAGTEIFVFSKDNLNKEPLKAVCDVNGTFLIDKIPSGEYIVLASSKAVNSSTYDFVYQYINSLNDFPFKLKSETPKAIRDKFFETYHIYDSLKIYGGIPESYTQKIDSLQNALNLDIARGTNQGHILSMEINISKAKLELSKSKVDYYNKIYSIEETAKKNADEILNNLDPKCAYAKYIMGSDGKGDLPFKYQGIVHHALKLSTIKIEKDKTQSVVFDFGTTYFASKD